MSITDPRHPLQMDLSAAEMKLKSWEDISHYGYTEGTRRWARGNAVTLAARVRELKDAIRDAQEVKP